MDCLHLMDHICFTANCHFRFMFTFVQVQGLCNLQNLLKGFLFNFNIAIIGEKLSQISHADGSCLD